MAKPTIAVFCMGDEGHFKLLLPLIGDLTRRGCKLTVFTHRGHAEMVKHLGAAFLDLFAKYPLDLADNTSVPIPCRYVSFAAVYAEPIMQELRSLAPSLVIYDTFTVVGWLAAKLLGLPYVNVSAGHNFDPAYHLSVLATDPRAKISTDCLKAVETLRSKYGLKDASPFSYVAGMSPYLNICCEPPAFLTEAEREPFEPLAFYGSIRLPTGESTNGPDTSLK